MSMDGHEGRRRFLFFMLRINFDRAFENLLRALLERGHTVHAALDKHKGGLPGHANHLFEALAAEYPAFSYGMVPAPRRAGRLQGLATQLRVATDYLRYLEPVYAGSHSLRRRVEARTPAW